MPWPMVAESSANAFVVYVQYFHALTPVSASVYVEYLPPVRARGGGASSKSHVLLLLATACGRRVEQPLCHGGDCRAVVLLLPNN